MQKLSSASLFLCIFLSSCPAAFPEDLSGEWTLRFSPPQMLKYWREFELKLPVDLVQNGNALTGTASWTSGLGPTDAGIGQNPKIQGSVDGKKISLQFFAQKYRSNTYKDILLNGSLQTDSIEGEVLPSFESRPKSPGDYMSSVEFLSDRVRSPRFILERNKSLKGGWYLTVAGGSASQRDPSCDFALQLREKPDGSVEGTAKDYSAPTYLSPTRQGRPQRVKHTTWKVAGRSNKGSIDLTFSSPEGGTARLIGKFSAPIKFTGTIQRLTIGGIPANSVISQIKDYSTFTLERIHDPKYGPQR